MSIRTDCLSQRSNHSLTLVNRSFLILLSEVDGSTDELSDQGHQLSRLSALLLEVSTPITVTTCPGST